MTDPLQPAPDRDVPRNIAFLRTRAGVTFSLSSLFLIVTLVAVGFRVTEHRPEWRIPLAILSVPALARVLLIAAHRCERGRTLSGWEKVGFYLGSIGTDLVVVLAAIVVYYVSLLFVAVALIGFPSSTVWMVGRLISLVAAGCVGMWLLVRTWPRQARS